MKNRSKFESELIGYIERISGNKRATKLYKQLFKSMNDKAFMQWLEDLATEKIALTLIVPNGTKGLDMSNLLDIGKELGMNLYERIWLDTPSGIPTLSIHKAMIINMLLRRLSQSVMSKMIVPNDDRSVDSLTGQPTKQSTGNSLTAPELELLASYGDLNATASELHTVRGGDEGAYRAYKALIASRGEARKNDIAPFKTGVKSSKMVNILFLSAMIQPV